MRWIYPWNKFSSNILFTIVRWTFDNFERWTAKKWPLQLEADNDTAAANLLTKRERWTAYQLKESTNWRRIAWQLERNIMTAGENWNSHGGQGRDSWRLNNVRAGGPDRDSLETGGGRLLDSWRRITLQLEKRAFELSVNGNTAGGWELSDSWRFIVFPLEADDVIASDGGQCDCWILTAVCWRPHDGVTLW